jgi:hypothetical protein
LSLALSISDFSYKTEDTNVDDAALAQIDMLGKLLEVTGSTD